MRTPIEALKEIRDRLTYFCLRTDGKYYPPWATELVGIIDDIIKYKKNTDNPFYVDIGTSVVAIRCSSNHDVVHRLDHVYSKGSIDYLEQMCARMNEEALGLQKQVNAAAMREALEYVLNFDASDDAAMDDGISDAERIAEYADHIEECQKKAHAALSAPTRNCDRFNSLYDAVVAWGREDQGWNDWPDDDAEDENDLINILTGDQEHELIDWLFAPAAERKGADA